MVEAILKEYTELIQLLQSFLVLKKKKLAEVVPRPTTLNFGLIKNAL